ncbi:Putative tetratricopeptide repeat domain containing family protein [Zea mays]|uniref:Putative tetratricopeptide repeat domain containing family protein n=1 Tax=Zea mays TaxID=4577 RepID=A0A1D6PF98_MAIZE|nr:Putative tetratricopeptide repeat domain containing family protein [Zea mays]
MMSYGIMGVTTTPEIGHHRQPWVRTTTLQEWMEYQKAVSYYAKALTFPTKSLSAFAGLAYTYHLMDDFEAAINYYHKALWLKPDDQFCTDMLTYALESICQITARRKPGRGLLTATGGVTC